MLIREASSLLIAEHVPPKPQVFVLFQSLLCVACSGHTWYSNKDVIYPSVIRLSKAL